MFDWRLSLGLSLKPESNYWKIKIRVRTTTNFRPLLFFSPNEAANLQEKEEAKRNGTLFKRRIFLNESA
jgi:hypothetical protein